MADDLHFVVLYSVPQGCIIAEVDGEEVEQFGPFGVDVHAKTMARQMFPDLTHVALSHRIEKLSGVAVIILGRRALRQSQRSRFRSTEALPPYE
jgi:hypothetical protein